MVKRVILIVLIGIFLINLSSAINITFNSDTPADNTTLNNKDYFLVNVTIGNFTGTPNVILELNNSFRPVNYTLSNATNITYQFNVTFLINRTFQYRVFVNDSIASNTTGYRTITVNYSQPWEYNSTYWKTTYINKITPFWANQFVASNGAFYMNVNQTGQRNNELLRAQMLGRHIYGMAVAYNLTSNETYKSMAINATNLLRDKYWDNSSGGFSDDDFNVSNGSQIINARNSKTMFGQSWASLGYLSTYWITSNSTYLNYAQESFSLYDQKTWNSTDKAYAETTNDSGSITSNQYTFSSTVDVAIALIIPLYSLTGNSTYLTRLKDITDSSLKNMVNESNDLIVGNYNPGWANNGNKEQVSIGHNTKYAWYLLYMYNLTNNETYKTKGLEIFGNATQKGWKDQYNLWLNEVNTTTNLSVNSDIPWWIIEDGSVGGHILYKYTNNDIYYDLFKKSTGTYLEKFLDQTNGEVYEIANESGSITNTDKGYEYKASYHSSEIAIFLSQTMDGFLGVPYGNYGTYLSNNPPTPSSSQTSSVSESGSGGSSIKNNSKISIPQLNNNETNKTIVSNESAATINEIFDSKNNLIKYIPLVLILIILLIILFLIILKNKKSKKERKKVLFEIRTIHKYLKKKRK